MYLISRFFFLGLLVSVSIDVKDAAAAFLFMLRQELPALVGPLRKNTIDSQCV